MIFNEITVAQIVEEAAKGTPSWVLNARKYSQTLRALVEGKDFAKELIERIAYVESAERAKARIKYAKDISDMFHRVMNKRQNVFDANGGSENIMIKHEGQKAEFIQRLTNFKSNKPLLKYMSEMYFKLSDIDPNGLILMEFAREDNNPSEYEVYPTYKNIDNIRTYEPDGQMLKYVIFEPKVIESDKVKVKLWRVVDDERYWTVYETGGIFTAYKELATEHPFGKTPGLVLSEREIPGSHKRLSCVSPVLELAKEYAIDKSVLNIYKKQKGFPVHWRYGAVCNTCFGAKYVGDDKCPECEGKGSKTSSDVTDMNIIPIPKDGQPSLGDKLMGFESPDLETWKQYKQDLRDMEMLIEDTIWGSSRIHHIKSQNETATGRYIDIQPITNTLNVFTDVAEYVHNTLANWVVNFVDVVKPRDEKLYYNSYGRRYIIESPDALMKKYKEAKESGDNNTILDRILDEIILAMYKGDPVTQEQMLKKAKAEPYVHLSTSDVNDIFGAEEALKKVAFQDFWEQADTQRGEKELKKEFITFFDEYKKEFNFKLNNDESSSSKTVPLTE